MIDIQPDHILVIMEMDNETGRVEVLNKTTGETFIAILGNPTTSCE